MNTYFENSEIFENFDDEVFSNFDPNAIIQGVTAVANLGGSIAQSSAQKQASKTEIQREIESVCGKRKPVSKKKKEKYEKCAKEIYDKYQSNKQQQTQLQQQQLQNQQQQLRNATIQQEKTKNRNLYIGLGVLAVLIGVVVYLKKTS
jgi:hypothetical protein